MILATVLSLSLLGQAALPGDALSVEEARAKATLIVVARRPVYGSFIVGCSGAHLVGSLDLQPSSTLKGQVEGSLLQSVSFSARGREEVPKEWENYIVFIQPYKGHLSILKVLHATPENIAAVKQERRADGQP